MTNLVLVVVTFGVDSLPAALYLGVLSQTSPMLCQQCRTIPH